MVSMLQIYKFGFDDLILLKPFHTMMSIGRVCYTDVTPFFSLRFIHPHPFLRAVSPNGRLEEDNRWPSRVR